MTTATIETGAVPLIYSKIQQIREQVGAVRKEGTGGVPYSFRGVDQVVNAIYPALNEHGVIIFPVKAERVLTQRLTGGTEKNGVLVGQKLMSTSDILLGLKIVAVEDGSSIYVEVAGESQDYSDKSTAQAHSVAYRIAILQTFTLPTDAPDPELNQTQPGGIEDSTGTLAARLGKPSKAELQAIIKEWVNSQEVVNPDSGDTSSVTSLQIDAIGTRISDNAPASKWKNDVEVLEKVIAEVRAGVRK